MSTKIEKLENSKIKLTIEVDASLFEEGINKAYNKNKGKIAIPGFRKGKAPRKMIEKIYGKGVFYEDAANVVIPDAYEASIEENNLDVVSRPEIDVLEMGSGKNFIFTAIATVKPEAELGEYKGLEVEKTDVEVTEEEINDELNKVAEQNSRMIEVTDRTVEDKDEVTVDFEGFVDGEAFEGGKGEDYPLVIGSHSFIDDFEEQLVGKNIGENIEVNVTFPEEYQQETLAGKPAMFKVTIKDIKAKELPAIDDEFAKDVSDFETLNEYKEDIKKGLQEKKETSAIRIKEDKVLDKAVANAKLEIPEVMISNEVESMLNNFAQSLQQQGMKLEQYLQFTGGNLDTFKETIKPDAEKRVSGRLILEAIAKAENIEVSEEDVKEELEKMATMYNMEVEKLMASVGEYEKKGIKGDIKSQKALKIIVDSSKEI